MSSFRLAAETNDEAAAASMLDLRSLAPELRAARGPELAAQLYYVFERHLGIAPERLSDDPSGDLADGADIEKIGSILVSGAEVPITLTRLAEESVWVFSASTVARIPLLYEEHGPNWIESRVPASLTLKVWGLRLWQWIGFVLAIGVAFVIGRVVTYIGIRIAGRLTRRTEVQWDDELIDALRRPSRFFVGILAFNELLSVLAISVSAMSVIGRLLGMVTIGALAWAAIGVVGVVARVVERRALAAAERDGESDLRARGVTTQVRVLQRVANIAISTVALALMLTQFEVVRNIGVSLLASAGVAGIVLGFAAQRTIGSLIAGIQLSFTQPIRIGDVVIVEKEWGTIEEVTLTYVVVRVWDERRLIVPMSRFLEQPFENWTKVSAQLHGTVFFYVDWRLPIDEMRKELDRIVEDHPSWDRRTKGIVVTNTSERTIEVRALVSARSSGDLWALRVHVREQLVSWLQRFEGGKYLPRVRVEADEHAAAEGSVEAS